MRVDAAEILLDLRLVEMHGGRDDVARQLVAELDDVFAEIGLDRRDAVLLRDASLMPISSAIIDLPLVTVLASAVRQIARMMSRASSALRAKCTWPPDAAPSPRRLRDRDRDAASVWSLMSRAESRSASNSGSLSVAFCALVDEALLDVAAAPSAAARRRARARRSP